MDDTLNELVTQILNIENEKKMLNEQYKNLMLDYKHKVDMKAFKAALRIAKIKSTVDCSEITLDEYVNQVERKLTI
jgi:uncharacterized protein (UPF0335 family)